MHVCLQYMCAAMQECSCSLLRTSASIALLLLCCQCEMCACIQDVVAQKPAPVCVALSGRLVESGWLGAYRRGLRTDACRKEGQVRRAREGEERGQERR